MTIKARAASSMRQFWKDKVRPVIVGLLGTVMPWWPLIALLLVLFFFGSTIGRWGINLWLDAKAERKSEKVEDAVKAEVPTVVRAGTNTLRERYEKETVVKERIADGNTAIRSAPGAATPLPDAFAIELRRAVCVHDVYAGDPACGVFRAGAAGVGEGGGGREAAPSDEADAR